MDYVMTRTVPVIDIAPFLSGLDKPSVVRQVADACENIGFLVIKGHGVPQKTINAVIDASKRFFALPPERKLAYEVTEPGVFRGYMALANMSLGQSLGAETPPDLREGFSINRVQDISDPYYSSPSAGKLFAPNTWPTEEDAPSFKSSLTEYYLALDSLSASLMRVFALALELPEDFFDSKIDKHFTNLAAYHYPPMPKAPSPGQLRGGVHSDFGSLTLVYGYPSITGLQVLSDGVWEDVPVAPGTFVVNLGDLMAQWTNDRWMSTLHRVVNPPESAWNESRYSLVFFHQPNYDARIESLDKTQPAKYPPITSGEHLKRKLTAMQVAS